MSLLTLHTCVIKRHCFFFFKELHAHLNGSISAKTMQTLIERKKAKAVVSGVVPQHWETTIAKGEQRTMEECVACDDNSNNILGISMIL